jgi:hypothetical protein
MKLVYVENKQGYSFIIFGRAISLDEEFIFPSRLSAVKAANLNGLRVDKGGDVHFDQSVLPGEPA